MGVEEEIVYVGDEEVVAENETMRGKVAESLNKMVLSQLYAVTSIYSATFITGNLSVLNESLIIILPKHTKKVYFQLHIYLGYLLLEELITKLNAAKY